MEADEELMEVIYYSRLNSRASAEWVTSFLFLFGIVRTMSCPRSWRHQIQQEHNVDAKTGDNSLLCETPAKCRIIRFLEADRDEMKYESKENMFQNCLSRTRKPSITRL